MFNIFTYKSYRPKIAEIIKEEIKDYPERQVYFVVPEASKANVERILFDELSKAGKKAGIKESEVEAGYVNCGLFNYDVLSFVRLATRIVSSVRGNHKDPQSELLMRNVLYRILTEHGREFRTISKCVTQFEYIDKINALLGDFRRYQIGLDELNEALNHADEDKDKSYYDKLYDFCLLLKYITELDKKYNIGVLKDPLNEASGILTNYCEGKITLKSILRNLKQVIDCKVVIYGFGNTRLLTPQETDFIKAMTEAGADINFYVCSDLEKETDIYHFGNILVNKLPKDLKDIANVNISEFSTEDDDNNSLNRISRFYTSEDDSVVSSKDEDGLKFSDDGSVVLSRLSDTDSSLAYICDKIVKLTKEENYRYSDIRIFTPNNDMARRLKGIMKLYKLDMYADRQVVLLSTPIMRYADLLLQLPLENYPIEKVLRILRTGLLPVKSELVDLFENFCKRENIRFADKIFDEGRYCYETLKHNVDFYDDDAYRRPQYSFYLDGKYVVYGSRLIWTAVVEKVLFILRDEAEKICASRTLKEKATALSEHLEGIRGYVEALRNEKLDANDKTNAEIIVASYKELKTMTGILASDLNDVDISSEAFAALIRIDMRNKVLASIPLTVDSVEICDRDTAYETCCKVLFVLGCDSGNFPHGKSSDGLFTDEELVNLGSDADIDLPNKSENRSLEDNIEASLILNAVTDRLYFVSENSETPSSVLTFIRKSFDETFVTDDSFKMPDFSDWSERRHTFETSNLDKDTIRALLGEISTMSVTGVEAFNGCPMNYATKYLLSVGPREDATSVQMNLIGSLAHKMFELCLKDMSKEANGSPDYYVNLAAELSENKVNEMARKYFDIAASTIDYPDYEAPLFRTVQGGKIKEIFKKAIVCFVNDFAVSGYLPYGFEQAIAAKDSDGNIESPLSYEFDDHIFKFKGYIDRVDRNEEDLLRIIDYKTGSKEINYRQIYQGLQIQLFAYALALGKKEGNPDSVSDVGYIRTALPYNENKILKYMSAGKKNITQEEFKAIVAYADKTIDETCKKIVSGIAVPLPNAEGVTCKYCILNGICGNKNVKNIKPYSVEEYNGKIKKTDLALGSIRKETENG